MSGHAPLPDGRGSDGRLDRAQPQSYAYGVLFLACDEASFITGHALAIDGGQTIDA